MAFGQANAIASRSMAFGNSIYVRGISSFGVNLDSTSRTVREDGVAYFMGGSTSKFSLGAFSPDSSFTDSLGNGGGHFYGGLLIGGDVVAGGAGSFGALSGTTGTFSSTVQATTGLFTNLNANTIPQHLSDASGLTNSSITQASGGQAITMSDSLIAGSTSANSPHLLQTNTANVLTLYRATSSAAFGAGINFDLQDASGSRVTYASIAGVIRNNATGIHSGYLQFSTYRAGVSAARVRIDTSGNLQMVSGGTATTLVDSLRNITALDVAVNGGDLTSSQTTFNLLNSTVTTGNLFGAGTTVSIGATTGTTTINNDTLALDILKFRSNTRSSVAVSPMKIFMDTTQNVAWIDLYWVPRTIDASHNILADSVRVTGTTRTALDTIVMAKRFPRAGKTVVTKYHGQYDAPSAGKTFDITFRRGSITGTLIDSIRFTTAGGATNQPFSIENTIVCRSSGASGRFHSDTQWLINGQVVLGDSNIGTMDTESSDNLIVVVISMDDAASWFQIDRGYTTTKN